MQRLDIAANRRAAKYTGSEMTLRILWIFGRRLFCLSPRPFFTWRRTVLRLFGTRIGHEVHIYSSAVIYLPWNLCIGDWSSIGEGALIYDLGLVTIGKQVTISHRAHLCAGTHDYGKPSLPLLRPQITIGDQAWICADAFIGPGVAVGEGAVVGARAVVVKDVPPWTVVAGNPARIIKKREMEPAA